MDRERLRSKVLYDVPEIKDAWPDVTSTVDNINTELNEAALEIAYVTAAIPKNNSSDPIDLTADNDDYELPSDFLCIDPDGGVQYLNADSEWDPLKQTTMDWLDENELSWRTNESDDPEYYYIKGNYIYLYPKPDTTRANALMIHYGTIPTLMAAEADEPFNNLTYLDPFHYLVALKVKIQAKQAKGKFADATILSQEYVARLTDMFNFTHTKRNRADSPDIIQRLRGYAEHYRR